MKKVYTIHELAQELGVTWQAVATWKRRKQIPAAAVNSDGTYTISKLESFIEEYKTHGTLPEPAPMKARKSSPKAGTKKTVKPAVDRDEFIRQYWQKGTRAADVLLMPQETASQILEHVNEALKYAYDKFK